jgi:hypothetical protein
MQGGAEVNNTQAAHRGRLDGLGQDPDTRVQIDQVDLVQHGGQAGDRAWRVPGQCTECFDFGKYRADPPGLGPLVQPASQRP